MRIILPGVPANVTQSSHTASIFRICKAFPITDRNLVGKVNDTRH